MMRAATIIGFVEKALVRTRLAASLEGALGATALRQSPSIR